jgi:hypothetical protein
VGAAMAVVRVGVLTALGLAVTGCLTSLPTPDYVVKTPPPYRIDADGTVIDNENYRMDAQGYRINKQGQRIGDVDFAAKMGTDPSNAMAGYYISSIGTEAPGRVAVPSEGAGAGPGYGPGSVNPMPSGTTEAPPAPGAPAPATPAPATPTPLTR